MFDTFRWEASPRRVRAVLAGTPIADSSRTRLLWEPRRLPVYYFPREDVRVELLGESGSREDAAKGPITLWTIQVGDRVAADAAWSCERTPDGCPDLSGYVAFNWGDMDAWYEEDDEVFVHPRDPYHRVDVLNSSRHVQVVVLGETVVDTHRPRVLFETGLPPRYYVPHSDVRMDMLVPSSTETQCPYKGVASYYGVRVGDRLARDMVWTYRFPIPECAKIENLVCFFDELVDAVYVDGELQARPETPWSRPRVVVSVE